MTFLLIKNSDIFSRSDRPFWGRIYGAEKIYGRLYNPNNVRIGFVVTAAEFLKYHVIIVDLFEKREKLGFYQNWSLS